GQAFELAHGREPDDAAVTGALAFLKAYRAQAGERGLNPEQEAVAAWAGLGRVLLTANAFLYVD
ncbi:MAG TPA: hypothetical protein VM597_00650, partial [Gemmataceae bacterium]|nr:hypothetical protein [Gemmataceae bacterium]